MSWSQKILAEYPKCALCENPSEEAHHIFPKADYPEIRTDKRNGVGLCLVCHRGVHEQGAYRFVDCFVTITLRTSIIDEIPRIHRNRRETNTASGWRLVQGL